MQTKTKYAFNPSRNEYRQVKRVRRNKKEFCISPQNSNTANVVINGIISPFVTVRKA